jgi:hypothetical protein
MRFIGKVLAVAVLASLVLTPMLAVASDDLPASPRTVHHESGVRHQPARAWRTLPAAVVALVDLRRAGSPAPLELVESTRVPSPLVRSPFVPPRG